MGNSKEIQTNSFPLMFSSKKAEPIAHGNKSYRAQSIKAHPTL